MKFLITENKIIKVLQKTLNNILKSEEYDWVDSIDIESKSTSDIGWRDKYVMPYYTYVINLKDDVVPDYNIQSKLFDSISMYHSLMFPRTEDNEPSAYFSTSTRLPDGRKTSFPILII